MPPGQPMGVHNVARVNATRGTGHFAYVTPLDAPSAALPAPAATGYAVRVRRANGTAVDYPAGFRRDACGDPDETDETGSLDLVVPNDPHAAALELLAGDKILARFTPATEPPEPTILQPAAGAAGGPSIVGAARASGARPKVTWTPVAPAPGPSPMAASAAAAEWPTYTVQMSTDGKSWRTVGIGLTAPEATLDPHLLAGQDKVRVRVTATNGFRTCSTTRVIDVKDLLYRSVTHATRRSEPTCIGRAGAGRTLEQQGPRHPSGSLQRVVSRQPTRPPNQR